MGDELVSIGYVIKTHGVKGHLRIAFHENCKELSISEALYFLVRGNMVPHFIKEIEYLKNDSTLILFEDFASKEEADRYTKREIYGPSGLLSPAVEELLNDWMNYLVVDEHAGDIGTVSGIIDMGEYDLIEVMYQGHELMIPLHEDTILSIDDTEKVIHVLLPDGLLDL